MTAPNDILTIGESERIYVAAKFPQYARARALMDDLTRAGHVITHDWTRTKEFGPDGKPTFELGTAESELPKDDLRSYANDDIRGVRTADRVIVLADQPDLVGAYIEVGAALALNIPVIVLSPHRYTVFWDHPLVTVLPDEDTIRFVMRAG